MKHSLALLIFLLTLCQSIKAQDKTGKVYFMRSTGVQGWAVAFTAFIDGQFVCKLNNKKYSVHEVNVGEHTFSVQFAGKSSKEKAEQITINIEGGKSYYVQMIFQPGLIKNNLYCQEVTEGSAKTILPECSEDTQCQ
jgi:VCBS repeat-containing protein